MSHARRVIREAIVAALKAAGTAAGGNVYELPSGPRAAFPALVVDDDGGGERQKVVSMLAPQAQRVVERRYAFDVVAEVQQAGATYARTRDDLLGQVEAALAAATLPGVKSIAPVSLDTAQVMSHDRPIVTGSQRFEVLYYTTQGDPATAL